MVVANPPPAEISGAWAGKTYEPAVDIWESEQALVLQADVPGVRKDDVEINLDQDVLTISGSGFAPLWARPAARPWAW